MMSIRHLLIHGLVQGVGFRTMLAWEARQMGVSGWVRNRREGTVEALLQGEAAAVANLIAWARSGPPGAQVTHIDVSAEEAADGAAEMMTDFAQLPTL